MTLLYAGNCLKRDRMQRFPEAVQKQADRMLEHMSRGSYRDGVKI